MKSDYLNLQTEALNKSTLWEDKQRGFKITRENDKRHGILNYVFLRLTHNKKQLTMMKLSWFKEDDDCVACMQQIANKLVSGEIPIEKVKDLRQETMLSEAFRHKLNLDETKASLPLR